MFVKLSLWEQLSKWAHYWGQECTHWINSQWDSSQHHWLGPYSGLIPTNGTNLSGIPSASDRYSSGYQGTKPTNLPGLCQMDSAGDNFHIKWRCWRPGRSLQFSDYVKKPFYVIVCQFWKPCYCQPFTNWNLSIRTQFPNINQFSID